jgi:hypothetical protein
MYPAIDQNLDRIRSDLARRGLTYEPLMEDLLDHICCLLEDRMRGGTDFETSYDQVLGVIGERQLPDIQHQTLLNLDIKHQRMKNFTYFFGLTSALVAILGAFFKRMHWPGASILIAVGIVFIVAVFLPLYFIISYREQSEKKNPVYPIVGYLTLALLLAGGLFKIMHWPGAGYVTTFSLGFLLVGFIPLYVVNAFQKGGSEKVRLPYLVMLIVGISLVMLFANVNISKYAVDIYTGEITTAEQAVNDIDKRTDQLLLIAQDSVDAEVQAQIFRIHDQATGLQVILDELRDELLESVDQPGASIQDVKGKDIRRKIWNDEGMFEKETEFINGARVFNSMLDEMFLDPVIRAQINENMEFTREIWPYEFGEKNFVGEPFIVNYHMIKKISERIALTEYISIKYIMEH